MANFENLEVGDIGLIQQTKEGRVLQIGLTTTKSIMLQNFLAILSQESPLVQMSETYDLILKSNVCKKCKLKK